METPRLPDKQPNGHLVRAPVLILTDQDRIEGTLYYPRGIRLSDALNAHTAHRERPHLPLVDATVTRIATGERVLRTRFLLVLRSKITVLVPKSELLPCDGEPWPDESARAGAAGAATELEKDIPSLMRALANHDELIRRVAAESLGRLGADAVAAVPALLEALEDPDDYVRGSAAEALGCIGADAGAAVPALRKVLKDRNEFVRCAAVAALGGLGTAARPAVPDLTAALRDRAEFVRRAAAEALGRIGPPAREAIPAVRQAVSDRDALVRHWASIALQKIQGE